ncbi:hypothetical protein AB0J72_04735 [Dactylosporangium sp. NPDC049742]|uniref:hypothetical protein n=1 Tax=Dactylosporangium sp. NPDC049742 TaxID=3154737 RepID=UPI0034409237
MTGIELIVAALAGGATAGLSGTVDAAIRDAYTTLRDLLRRRLSSRRNAEQVLDAEVLEPNELMSRLGADLEAVSAGNDSEVLNAAQHLMGLVDPNGAASGRYAVTVGGKTGDLHISTNYGTAANNISGPVTISYGQLPVPPAQPGLA